MKDLLLVGIALIMLGVPIASAQDTPSPPPGDERVELAKRVYRERIRDSVKQRLAAPNADDLVSRESIGDPLFNEGIAEDLSRWSVRWLEAESDAATDRPGRIKAAQAHLDRMIALESGKMVRQELADDPWIKELIKDQELKPTFESSVILVDLSDLLAVDSVAGKSARHYLDVARYARLEAEVRLKKLKGAP